MATSTAVPREAISRQPARTERPALSLITGKGAGLPNRYIAHAVEGWGKTSFGAQTPKPIFLETKGETGLETLIDHGQLPETPHFPVCNSWEALLGAIETLTEENHEYRTLVGDTLNGAERLCHEFVCNRDFNGDWTDKGFMGYMRGFEISLSEWRRLLNALDTLRERRRMSILWLCHTRVKPFKNPEGADYDRYQPDMHEKTWGLTHKWADVVLFGNFEITITTGSGSAKKEKGKASGGQQRMMYTERHAAYDAKNRLGLTSEIEMGSSAAEAWANFMTAVKAGRGTHV